MLLQGRKRAAQGHPGGGLVGPCRIRRALKRPAARRGARRRREGRQSHESKGKGKAFGRGLRCYGCASTHPWSQCRLVKYQSRKELCGKCGERGHLQELCRRPARVLSGMWRSTAGRGNGQ